MARMVDIEAARRSFLTAGPCAITRDVVRGEVLASWERSQRHGVDPDRVTARFLGHHRGSPLVIGCAEDVFDDFFKVNEEAECSLVLVDARGVIRVRRDGGPGLAGLLDSAALLPGYEYSERSAGTSGASVALHEQADVVIRGPEHYHGQLTFLGEAASLVPDSQGGIRGVVVVMCHQSDETTLQLPLARMLAQRIAARVADQPYRAAGAIFERFSRCCERADGWVLATDGDWVLTNAQARLLDAGDLRVLTDLALASEVLREFTSKHVDLPSGHCAEIATEGIYLAGEPVGGLLTGTLAGARPATEPAEAVRRQGSHVAPTGHRDYAKDLRWPAGAQRIHAEARIRANQELLTPYLRARQEVIAGIKQGRNHLLIGEPGVGKQTLVRAQFRQAFPHGRVVTVGCASFMAGHGPPGPDPVASILDEVGNRPHLLLLCGMNGLTPVGVRRLDESLRPLVALPAPPLVVGCIDTPGVDATRPYGLLLRHFHEITRVPALRYRSDEIGDIALSILRRLAGRRSLRLSLQVVRVLEGYAWPGNISELEDVLRYVLARKPVGEIQPPDLPLLCFQGRSHKMSMLEAAQCDAIIQALYESRGNRYKAAGMLGIARSSLYRKIDAFGISYIA
jgi:sigma-54 dependent transcriptional regulator, acetoin dehydrogenase operon transcriptional activator AcoR